MKDNAQRVLESRVMRALQAQSGSVPLLNEHRACCSFGFARSVASSAILVVTLVSLGCGRNDQSEAQLPATNSGQTKRDSAAHSPVKLTRYNIERLLPILRHQPNACIDGWLGVSTDTREEALTAIRKANQCAKEHGFRDSDEFYNLMFRVNNVGKIVMQLNSMDNKRKQLEESIKEANRRLQREGLTEGERDAMRLSIKYSLAELESLDRYQPPMEFSSEELSLFREYSVDLRMVIKPD